MRFLVDLLKINKSAAVKSNADGSGYFTNSKPHQHDRRSFSTCSLLLSLSLTHTNMTSSFSCPFLLYSGSRPCSEISRSQACKSHRVSHPDVQGARQRAVILILRRLLFPCLAQHQNSDLIKGPRPSGEAQQH